MEINEKQVKVLLQDIKKDLYNAYSAWTKESSDIYVQRSKAKIETLLTIIDFK